MRKGGRCKCGAWRSRLHTCLTCGAKLCGGCSFKSARAGGRVCPGACHRAALDAKRDSPLWTKALVALLLVLTPAFCHGQGLYNLGFTLHGEPGPGWVETPLGVVSQYDALLWRLTLRGVVPVAEILRERVPHA